MVKDVWVAGNQATRGRFNAVFSVEVGYMRKMRIYIAVVLALVMGGSGYFSFGNMAEAAEAVEASEAAGLTSASVPEESAADESNLPAQVEQNHESGNGEAESEEKVFLDAESSDGEQQESLESLEGAEAGDSADASEDGSKPKPDDHTGTDSSQESTEQSSSSETGEEETLDQNSGSGTDAGDVSSGDNVGESGSMPSSGLDNNAGSGGSAQIPEQSGEGSEQDSSSASESSQVLSDTEKNSSLDRTEIAGDGQRPELQIPEKITVVVDPWEIKGEGQIHSEQYIISNKGTAAVKLTLYNLACVPQEAQGGIVKTVRDGIHQGGSKAIYMEMVFGNGDSVLFTEDGSSRYEIELAAGEELSFQITGELNENAAEPWRDGDFQVLISYQWDDGVHVPAEVDGGKAVSGEMRDTSLDAGGIISNGTAEKEENSADPDSAVDENQPLDEAAVEGERVSLKEGATEAGSLSPEADSVDMENVMPDRGAVKEGDTPLTADKGSEKGDSVAPEEVFAGNKNLSEGIEEKAGSSRNDDGKESGQESLDTGQS